MNNFFKEASLGIGIFFLVIALVLLLLRQNSNSNELIVALMALGALLIFIPLVYRKANNT